jgi:hypothetical protein
MPRGKKSLGRVYQRNGWQWLDYQTLLGRVQESAHTKDRAQALDLLGKKIGDVNSGKIAGPNRVTVNNLLGGLLAEYERENRATLYDLECRTKKHLGRLLGPMRASEVTPLTIGNYVKKRLKERAAPATVKRELANLKRAFQIGVLNEIIHRVPAFPKVAKGLTRSGFIDVPGYRALLRELPRPDIQCLLVLGYHVGMRRGKLLTIRKAWIDFDDGVIYMQSGSSPNNKAWPRSCRSMVI